MAEPPPPPPPPSQLQLKLFNSMTKAKEPFQPRVEGKVGMFCGVTPYDFSHVGHARAYVAFDVMYRYLKFLGYEVEYVRNFTDIDDKIIRHANEAGETHTSLSSRFINEFLLDMSALQCLPPTHEPRVTEHIEHIIELITKIMQNGHGYAIEGDVDFSVDSFPEYLLLSGRKLDQNCAGERVAVDTRKRNPADFALWKELDDARLPNAAYLETKDATVLVMATVVEMKALLVSVVKMVLAVVMAMVAVAVVVANPPTSNSVDQTAPPGAALVV